MDFFVWQGRSREPGREFGQHAARLPGSVRLQAHTHPAWVERHAARRRSGTGLQASVHAASAGGVNSYAYSRRVQRSQAEKDAISWCVMGWDWYKPMRMQLRRLS